MKRILNVTRQLAVGLVVSTSGVTLGAPGDFDPSFNRVGFIRDLLPDLAFADAVAIHSSGEIVTSGWYSRSDDNHLVVWRHLSDGTLDNSFGGTGIIYPPSSPDFYGTTNLAIDHLDRIILGIQVPTGYTVYRFNLDGSPDLGFGGTGSVDVSLQAEVFAVSDFAIQPDNKIVGVGGTLVGRSQFLVYRLDESGQLDSTFGGTGLIFTEITPGGGSDRALGVAIQSDGKIVAAGRVRSLMAGAYYEMALVRYLATGELDSEFGNGGKVVFSILDDDLGRRVAIQPDGRILITGTVCTDLGGGHSYCYFGMGRVDQHGVLDPDFGGTGKVTTDLGWSGSAALDLALQSDNKIVVTGFKALLADYSVTNAILIRYQPDGSLDPTFGVNGISETGFGYTDNNAYRVRIQADGRLLTAGYTARDTSAGAVTARYLSQ